MNQIEMGNLIPSHLEALNRYSRQLTRGRPRADTEDLVQETVLLALTKCTLFKEGSLRSWLLTLMHHQFINTVRKENRRGETSLDVSWMEDPCSNTDSDTLIHEIERELSNLPARMREILALIKEGDLTYDQIAASQGIPTGTARSRLSRGRDLLWSRIHGEDAKGRWHKAVGRGGRKSSAECDPSETPDQVQIP